MELFLYKHIWPAVQPSQHEMSPTMTSGESGGSGLELQEAARALSSASYALW